MTLDELRLDSAIKQKKGLHFILGSIVIWTIVLAVHLTDLPILTKNLYTFVATAPLLPIAWGISRVIGVDFSNKENPLTQLGILFSVNQMLYLLIAMWVYAAVPNKLVMVLALIFGAHLMPFAWLYRSRAYLVFSILIPLAALAAGLLLEIWMIPAMMLLLEVAFSIALYLEVKQLPEAVEA